MKVETTHSLISDDGKPVKLGARIYNDDGFMGTFEGFGGSRDRTTIRIKKPDSDGSESYPVKSAASFLLKEADKEQFRGEKKKLIQLVDEGQSYALPDPVTALINGALRTQDLRLLRAAFRASYSDGPDTEPSNPIPF